MPTPPEDFELTLRGARASEERAWRELYAALAPAMTGFLRGRGAADADDLVGDAFVQIVRDLHRFEGDWAGLSRLSADDRSQPDARRPPARRPAPRRPIPDPGLERARWRRDRRRGPAAPPRAGDRAPRRALAGPARRRPRCGSSAISASTRSARGDRQAQRRREASPAPRAGRDPPPARGRRCRRHEQRRRSA